MSDELEFTNVISQTITLTTTSPGLTIAVNHPAGARAAEIYGTGTSTPTWNFTPRLRKAFWYDVTAGTYTDITTALTDRTTATSINSFDGAASHAGDLLYIGCDVPFRGVYVDVTNTNGTASTLDASYWNGAWTDLSTTDGTASGGATLAQDAPITWTMPTDWATTSVNGTGNLFWVYLWVSADLDSSVSIANLVPLGVQTAQPTSVAITSTVRPRYIFDNALTGGIEATGDNADTLVINWLCSGRNTGQVSQ